MAIRLELQKTQLLSNVEPPIIIGFLLNDIYYVILKNATKRTAGPACGGREIGYRLYMYIHVAQSKYKIWCSAFVLFPRCNHKNLISSGVDFFALKRHINNAMRRMYFAQQCATVVDSPACV